MRFQDEGKYYLREEEKDEGKYLIDNISILKKIIANSNEVILLYDRIEDSDSSLWKKIMVGLY